MRKNTIIKALHEEEYLDRLAPFASFLSKFSEDEAEEKLFELDEKVWKFINDDEEARENWLIIFSGLMSGV